MTGRVIGHYRILERIGAGGMGVVYSAEDLRLQRTVALKFLPPSAPADARARERMFAEARAASALDHPNICTVHAIEETPEGEVFIVMPAYSGETLKARLDRSGALPVEQALRIAVQVSEGVARAHAAGIVHRDIKPANVMLTADGVPKILDFGLAMEPEGTVEYGSSVAGTLAYMSPEQAAGEPIDAGADIWALGVMLYEMLAGAAPFQGESATQLLAAIVRAQPTPIVARNSDIPRPIAAIVTRALAPSRGARYTSADGLLADLRAAMRDSDSGTRAPAKRVPSIAVLPFSDMSAARDHDWFCEGIAEELINALAVLQNVRVAARTSSFQFRGQALDVRAIGDKLDAQTVLEGSVRKAGNRLRITVQLIDVASGYHLWSERYDRDMDDVFAVQDEIARQVVEKLRVKLSGDEAAEPLVKPHTAKPEAYEKYLEGRYHWIRRDSGALQKAIVCFTETIAMDPGYALAHAGLADAYSVLGLYGIGAPRTFGPLAQASAARAVELDPDLPESHAARALVQWSYERDWDGAVGSYERALALNPHLNVARGQSGPMLVYTGRPSEGIARAAAASQAEPFNPVLSFYYAAMSAFVGLDEQGLAECERMLKLFPDAPLSLWMKAMALRGLGRVDDAIAVMERGVALLPESTLARGTLGNLLAIAGHRDRALEAIQWLTSRRETSYVSAKSIADAFAGLRDADSTMAWLERAFEERDGFLVSVFSDRGYAWLRGDPRFLALFRRMKLGEPWPDARSTI